MIVINRIIAVVWISLIRIMDIHESINMNQIVKRRLEYTTSDSLLENDFHTINIFALM